jgi:hypothetical protein
MDNVYLEIKKLILSKKKNKSILPGIPADEQFRSGIG